VNSVTFVSIKNVCDDLPQDCPVVGAVYLFTYSCDSKW